MTPSEVRSELSGRSGSTWSAPSLRTVPSRAKRSRGHPRAGTSPASSFPTPTSASDPRALAFGAGAKAAALHAKAIAVDDRRAFVTSANFTEAAHNRNIEAGVLVDSAPFATSLRLQFDSLLEAGHLRRLPLAD